MALFLTSAFYILLTIFWGVFYVRFISQRQLDRQRKTYRVSFPSDLDAERVQAWVRSISGTLRPRGVLFGGTPSIAFEMWSDDEGITHRLRVPWQHVEYIVAQLRSLVPGVSVEEVEGYPRFRPWTRAVELKINCTTRTLNVISPVDTANSLLATVAVRAPGETVMTQWVVTPAAPRPLPEPSKTRSDKTDIFTALVGGEASKDEIADRRKKLGEPNVMGVLRIAAAADTEARAAELIANFKKALASTRGPHTRFQNRLVGRDELQRRIETAAAPAVYPAQLSASELVALIAWPVGNPFVAGLAPVRTRPLPVSAAIPSAGRILGLSTMPGSERPVAMAYKNHAVRHVHVLGPNGTGKSTLLANMIVQDMRHGHGVILIESKRDLFEMALDMVPAHRADDVIVMDLEDTAWPVGFNIFDQGNSRNAIDELASLISTMYKETSASLTAPQVLYYMLHALAETPGHTFVDLPDLLAPHPADDPRSLWQAGLIDNLSSNDTRAFMQRYINMKPAERDRLAAPVFNRTWEFTARPEVKFLLGQRKSSFQMTDVISKNKILLVNLAGARVGQGTASLVGTLLVNAIWQAVRTVTPDKENFLYLDEFQDVADLPIGLEAILAKARSAKLGAVLAHQNLGQLKRPELRSAVLANAVTKIVFQTVAADAAVIAREFGRQISDQDFINLERYRAITAVSTDKGVSPPTTIATYPLAPSTGLASKVRDLSRKKYGRAAEHVELDLESRPRFDNSPNAGPGKPKYPQSDGWGV